LIPFLSAPRQRLIPRERLTLESSRHTSHRFSLSRPARKNAGATRPDRHPFPASECR
jgi:hypothetical protein